MAKQISNISLTSMNNGAHFAYMKQTGDWLNLETAVKAKVSTEFEAFATAFAELDRCLKISQKSELTDKISEQDALRDASYMGLKGAVKSFLNFPEGDMLDAAKKIWQLIVDYNIDVYAQLDKETGQLLNFCDDLASKLSTEVTKLSLTPFVEQLTTANQQVKTLMAERDAEVSTRIAGEMKAARKAMDAAYRELVTKVNAYAVIEGDADYATFIDNMNSMIKRYREEVLTASAKKSATTVSGAKVNPAASQPSE